MQNRFGNRNLGNPLGFAPFDYQTANDVKEEPMEGEIEKKPIAIEVTRSSGGAISKFKKEKKAKR